ncbi:MAG: hypothetical protein FJ267_16605, partial [Planctomycetes bacterium]|nr:hypothetical protein [Planctomycetota bacterium]
MSLIASWLRTCMSVFVDPVSCWIRKGDRSRFVQRPAGRADNDSRSLFERSPKSYRSHVRKTQSVAAVVEKIERRVLLTTINLGSLTAAQGVAIFGAEAGDRAGRSVSGIGDINGDGFEDLLIGAYYADSAGNAKSDAGDNYVIFGSASLPTSIDLATLGTSGITISGATAGDYGGVSGFAAGDFNGDGFADFLIGADRGDAASDAKLQAGESYLIFGKASLPTTLDLANLGSAGTTFFGADAFDFSGHSVSTAGDVNGDGLDDLIIGAYFADGPSNSRSS